MARFALNGTTSHVDYPASYSSIEAGHFMSNYSVPKEKVPKLQKNKKIKSLYL